MLFIETTMKNPFLARLRACLFAEPTQAPLPDEPLPGVQPRERSLAAMLSQAAKTLTLAGAAGALLLGMNQVAQAQAPSVTRNPKIGGNFWFRVNNDTYESGAHKVFRSNANFATDDNPFDQTFLDEIQPYSTLRTMEWNPTNSSTEQNWSDRRQKSDPVQNSNPGTPDNYYSVTTGTGGTPTKGVAYEWQIKLCNLKNTNYWVNIPHRATDDYIKNLADLVRDNLNSNLTVYVEWSNEVWNSSFSQSGYAKDQGNALNIPNQINNVDSGISWDDKARQGYYVYRSLQAFKIFKQEFGGNSGRVKCVLAGLVHDGWQSSIWNSVLNNSSLNPSAIKPDFVADSFYPGQNIDGAASDALTQLYNDEATWLSTLKQAKANATNIFGCPLALYEAGYSVFKNADVLGASPSLYDWQKKMLDDTVSQADLVMIYAHMTKPSTYQAYGLKSYIGQPIADAHRYRALIDWLNGNTSGATTPTPTPTPAPSNTESANSVSGPTSVNLGQTVNVSVNYSASTSRWIWVMLLNKDASYSYQGGGGANVSAGSGTVSVSVPVSSSAPTGTNYCWQAQVQDTSGTNVANTAQQDGISVVAPSSGNTSANFIGRTISLKSVANGNYVQAQNGNGALIAQSGSVGTWEKFQVEDAGSGYVWLKSVSAGKYLWANSDGSSVTTSSTIAQDWERFTISAHPNQSGKYLLTAKSNGKYLMLSNGGASPSTDKVLNVSNNAGTWEAFQIDDQGSSSDPSNLIAQ